MLSHRSHKHSTWQCCVSFSTGSSALLFPLISSQPPQAPAGSTFFNLPPGYSLSGDRILLQTEKSSLRGEYGQTACFNIGASSSLLQVFETTPQREQHHDQILGVKVLERGKVSSFPCHFKGVLILVWQEMKENEQSFEEVQENIVVRTLQLAKALQLIQWLSIIVILVKSCRERYEQYVPSFLYSLLIQLNANAFFRVLNEV
jgi:hypothetical protein